MPLVRPHGLPPDARVQPAVEDPAARPQRRLAALERRPRDSEARLQCGWIGNPGLKAVSNSGTERQSLVHPDVVLKVNAGPRMEEVEPGVAEASRVEYRRAGLECGEAAEHVSTK